MVPGLLDPTALTDEQKQQLALAQLAQQAQMSRATPQQYMPQQMVQAASGLAQPQAPQAPQAPQVPQPPTPQSARNQGLMAPMAVPPAGGPQGVQSAFGTPEGQQHLRDVYKTMAQYSQTPGVIGQNYISALQQQQRLDAENTKIGQYLRMFGTINPRDWTADSMKKFYDNFRQRGTLDHSLLTRYEGMSGTEEKFLDRYTTQATEAQGSLFRIADLTTRMENQIGRLGVRRGRLAGGFDRIMRDLFGLQDTDLSLLRTEFTQMVNTDVINNLPPGVASDRDIAIVREGYPNQYADPAYIAAFLRGMQKIKIAQHEQNSHHAAYLGAFKSQDGLAEDWTKTGLDRVRRRFASAGLDFYDAGGVTHEQLLGLVEQDFDRRYGTGTYGPPSDQQIQGMPFPSATPGQQPPVRDWGREKIDPVQQWLPRNR